MTWGRAALAVAVIVGIAAWTPADGTAVTAKELDALAEGLRAESFLDRQAAYDKLLPIRDQAAPRLAEMLKDATLPVETRVRINGLLSNMDRPIRGVVWRGMGGTRPPEGVQDGDVVTGVNGVRVVDFGDWAREVGKGGTLRLDMWREGKGPFSLSVPIDERTRQGVTGWPDALERYRRHGVKGPWDEKVIQAFRMLQAGRPSFAQFQQIGDTGCGDPQVGALLFRMARYEMFRLDQSSLDIPVCESFSYPEGDYEAWFAEEVASSLVFNGHPAKAAEVLEKAAAMADKSGAWRAKQVLRRAQLAFVLQGAKTEILAFWKNHGDVLLTEMPWAPRASDPAASTAEALAALEGPDATLGWLRGLRETEIVVALTNFYAEQAALAGKSVKTPANLVLIDCVRHYGPVRQRRTDDAVAAFMLNLPGPGMVRMDARVVQSYRSYSRKMGELRVILRQGWGSPHIVAAVQQTGQITVVDGAMEWSEWSGVRVNPVAWNSIDLTLGPNFQRVSLNGKPVHAMYREPGNNGQPLNLWIAPISAVADFSNLQTYVYSDAVVDNQVVGAAFLKLDSAFHQGDPATADNALAEIRGLLAKVPEAESRLAQLAEQVKQFNAVFADGGLVLSTEQSRRSVRIDDEIHGTWTVEGDTLTASRCHHCDVVYLAIPLWLPDDVEITGTIEIENRGRRTFAEIGWNTGRISEGYSTAMFFAGQSSFFFGLPGDSDVAKDVDYMTPTPFCIRARGKDGAAFLRFGTKPDLMSNKLHPAGRMFVFRGGGLEDDTKIRFRNITARPLAKDVALDAPARMPGEKEGGAKKQW